RRRAGGSAMVKRLWKRGYVGVDGASSLPLGDWLLMAVGVAMLGAGALGLIGSDAAIVARAADLATLR
ncbi:MAG: hypothetical protein AAF698_10915, partial [Pseudomonadota bacterium]